MDLFKLVGLISIKNDEANKAIDETTDKGEEAQGSLASSFKKIGGAIATYLAVDKIIDFGKEIVNVAAEVSAETSAFEQIMGDYSAQASEKVSKIAEATGMVDTRLTPYMTSMTAKFKGLGYGVDEATSFASRGLNLAADASAFWDKSLDESMSHLNSFINGSYEGGEAIGLFANDTQLAAYAIKQGIVSETKEWSALDEATKQATRLEYAENMMKQSGATGQAAKEAGQYANVQANLTEKWRQFKAQIGEPLLQNVVIPVMGKVSGAVDVLAAGVKYCKDNWETFRQKAQEVAGYLSYKFGPAIDNIKNLFNQAKEAVQPIIDKLKNFVTSGEAAELATSVLKGTVDALSGALEFVTGLIVDVVEGFKSVVQWGKENETVVQMVAIAIGTLTAAIGAYNIAMAIKKAGGIAEIAQLGILQVQIWGLQVAETAHTVATTIATAATTAFGAAMAFLTSPITLVIAAIGALIAIGVLLVKNWDTIKAWFSELWQNMKQWASDAWEGIKNVWNNVATWFNDNIIQPVISFFKGLWEGIKAVWDGICLGIEIAIGVIASILDAAFQIITLPFRFIWENCKQFVFAAWEWIKNAVSNAIEAVSNVITTVFTAIKDFFVTVWEGIKNVFTTVWTAIVDFVTPIINNIKTFIITVFTTVKNTVTTIFNAVKNVITTIWNAIKTAITTAVNAIKNTVSNVFNAVKNVVSSIFNGIKTVVTTIWNGIKNAVSNAVNAVKSKVTSVFNSVKSTVSSVFNGIKNTATTVWNGIKNAIVTPIETAKEKISGIVDKIKGFFTGLKLEFPKIKLPHFSVKPKGWKIEDLVKGSIPTLGIEWYAKAMNSPMLLDKPTVFGYDSASGNLLGAGEKGTEVVAGANTLMGMISGAVENKMSVMTDALVSVLTAILNAILNGNSEMLQALLSGQKIVLDRREVARVVKEYA